MASATRPTRPPISCLPEYLLASSCSILSFGLGPRAAGPAGVEAAICRVDGALAGNDSFGPEDSEVEPGCVAAGLVAAVAAPVVGAPAIAAATFALTSERPGAMSGICWM